MYMTICVYITQEYSDVHDDMCIYITQEYSDVCILWRKTYVLHLSGRTICDTSHQTMYIRKRRTVVCETHYVTSDYIIVT